MSKKPLDEIEELRVRLREAEETLDAIRTGAVDAVVVDGAPGLQVFTLEGANHPYRVLVESMNEGALTLSPEGTIIYSNQKFSEMIATPLEKILGHPITRFVAPEDLGRFSAMVDDHFQAPSKGEFTLITSKGEPVSVHLSGRSLEMPDVESVCVVVTDITERKRAEAILKQTVADLTRSNADLEKFAYVASHDLQEPLRNVASCLQMLEKKYKNQLDAKADEYIQYAVEGAVRMKALIQDLLAYSRIVTRGNPPQPINCEKLLDRSVKNLRSAIAEAGAVITHDPLPTIPADDTQFLQVFQNLVGNAIKFRRDEPPQIHVSAVKKKKEWVFSVKDNGIGIESRHLDRIFVIFQRLHKRSQYGGTGIGLAIVKKVVERHGGRVWVESEFGSGATFYFTMPAKGMWT